MMKVADDQNNTLNSTELVLFKDGDVSLEVPVIPEEDTVWLSQAQMVELYSRDVSVISRHIRNIFKEGELDKESNLHFLQIANADRPVAFYSLDVIISVGYRVKSHREKNISCTQGCSSLSFCFSFTSQDWLLNRFPRTALKTERYFCCSEARQAIQ